MTASSTHRIPRSGVSVIFCLIIPISCASGQDSSFFAELRRLGEHHGRGHYSLDELIIHSRSVDSELKALEAAHFRLDVAVGRGVSAKCGGYTLPVDEYILLRRDTLVSQAEEHSYFIAFEIESDCTIADVTGWVSRRTAP